MHGVPFQGPFCVFYGTLLMTMFDTGSTLEFMRTGLSLALRYWWVYTPFILGFAAYEEWFSYQRAKYLASITWVLLEVVPPPEVLYSSPKAAESVFAGLHASYGGGSGWKGQFFEGKVPTWFSFEVVSDGGTTHFYIRTPADQRNVVESIIFAQYPDAEIRVVEDYIGLLPEKLDLNEYDVSGAELEFTKAQAYPIKTYIEFEEAGGKDEYARLDPIAPLMEVMSALGPGEHLWMQYVLRATGGDWVKEGQAEIDKLAGKPEKKPSPPLEWLFGPIDALLSPPSEPKKEEKAEFNLQKLTPIQKEVLERVEGKMSKLAFKVCIRLMYAARKESFNGSRIASVTAMYKQLYYNNLNSFKPGNSTRDKGMLNWMFPKDKGFFAGERTARKKGGMFSAYRGRQFAKKFTILTTEELATLWHLPGLNVRAPMMPRVQAKKGQPPAILPTR